MSEKKIRVLKDGPYQVTGDIPLNQMEIITAEDGGAYDIKELQTYDVKKTYVLCRCGKSKNKPFCDGSHVKEGFVGTESASFRDYDEMQMTYEGDETDLVQVSSYCAIARFCDYDGGIVRHMRNGETERAIKEACDCISGSLVMQTKEGQKIEPELETEISVIEDPYEGVEGPLWVKNYIEVESEECGRSYEKRNRVTLCRCGKSNNKPFCDGNHVRLK